MFGSDMTDKVCIFWDNSNIFIPAQYVATNREGIFASKEIRVEFERLFQLARMGRDLERAICVGSVPPELEKVWTRLRSTGVEVELYERGKGSGQEQGVDQCLQVHVLRALVDVRPPGIAVLLTGGRGKRECSIAWECVLRRKERVMSVMIGRNVHGVLWPVTSRRGGPTRWHCLIRGLVLLIKI